MCRTGGRRCPSSKLSGAELAAKNKHRRELYAANKAKAAAFGEAARLADQWRHEDTDMIVVPAGATNDEKDLLVKQLHPAAIIPGKISDENPYQEKFAAIQKATDELVAYIREINERNNGQTVKEGNDDTVSGIKKTVRAPVKPTGDLGDFKFIGRGADKVAYYHQPTNLVYKVLQVSKNEDVDKYFEIYERQEQYLIAQYDEKVLEKHNLRYATNYFTRETGGTTPVFVQEYLPDNEYCDYNLEEEKTSYELRELSDAHFVDMHDGNVRKNVKTGEIVMFDCLQVGAGEIRTLKEFYKMNKIDIL